MRRFNTSGPNNFFDHYTIQRTQLINTGVNMISDTRYFTIWAPRQTGKSTYFRQLSDVLRTTDYQPVYFSVEGFDDYSASDMFDTFCRELKRQQNIDWQIETFKDFERAISTCNTKKLVVIIDEIEGLNPKIFNQFLHTIRNLYHTRETHCLKSIILVGVSNIVGVVSDNASPFNIADNLNVPYFTDAEVLELLHQHESETGQLFAAEVKEKISQITANQPGLVNSFAQQLIAKVPLSQTVTYSDYLAVEEWFLTEAIDKNFSNILNKAKEQRNFVERLLFTEDEIPFEIDRESIKLLHTNGLIKKDEKGNVTFWVPFYKKRLYKAFYPYTNGEKTNILRSFIVQELFDANNCLKLDYLIDGYKTYTKRRGFNVFRGKDDAGNYKAIKESALIYSFETYIQAFLQVVDGKSYREADTGLGKSDLIIHVRESEYIIESKIYYYESQFEKGKKQLAYYAKSLGLTQGVYLVFFPNTLPHLAEIANEVQVIDGVQISTYLIEFDEEKW